MDRILADIAGVLRGEAIALRNISDVLDAHGHTTAAEKAGAAHQLILEAARSIEDDIIGAQNAGVSTVQTGAEHEHKGRS